VGPGGRAIGARLRLPGELVASIETEVVDIRLAGDDFGE